ncbi:uncharacterized protein F5147DRAFT_656118 [Suillus discolor]|uniref:SNF2 N-terminal domain-containing protein n=1 Tax=Suillus discolor TaxID=1912936 RepID=A0A9P7F005_9AGAM|nr:uncharacterized protein F5147DRAFT_656118 [Suillus discolor]KAG2098226.1 hypothetical protein F5147DRAFT_656118 [Suillus discolor]
MPTITTAGALLALGAPSPNEGDPEDNDLVPTSGEHVEIKVLHPPWCWPKWQECTGLTSVPFPAVAVTPETSSPWKTSEAAEAVSTFISNFWAFSEAEQVNYIRCLPDNDTKGHDLWLSFFNAQWSHWKVISILDAILVERALDPYSIMRRMRILNPMPLPHLMLFHQLPELATSQITLAYPSIGEALFGMDAFTEDHIALKEPVWCFIDNLMAWKGALSPFSILIYLLTSTVVGLVLTELVEGGERPDMKLIRTWLKGVEGLTKILTRYGDKESLKNLAEQWETLSDILQVLGIDHKGQNQMRLPKPLRDALHFLASEKDITLLSASIQEQLKLCDPDAETSDSVPELNLDGKDSCDFEWSEGVEVFKHMSEDHLWTLLGIPDQCLPFFNTLQDPYGKHNPWTEEGEDWKDRQQWRGGALNILDLPVILVMLATLIHQFTLELHRYLRQGSFDILPYKGKWSNDRALWWKNIWTMPKLPEGRQILIIPPKALESDFEHILEASNVAPTQSPRQRASYPTEASTTVYGRCFLLVGIDEAQNLRNIKKSYWALFALRERSESIVTMTATPITNRPMNVWNLGRCLGMEAFGSPYDGEAEKMDCDLHKSAAKDRQCFKQGDRDKTIITANLKGDAQVQIPSLYQNQMLKWICIICQRFSGVVIHRSVWSVDNVGVRISSLATFQEHSLLVKLYDHEVENLELIAQELVEKGGISTAAKFAGGSVPLSIFLMGASADITSQELLHPNTLVEVIHWHLELDARALLRVVEDNLVPSAISANSANENSLVLQLHEVQVLQIHGKITIPARTEIIAKFKNSRRDGPRVGLPLQKTIHVYRLVAADTQDVFLNNLSFDKAAVLNAFTGATSSLRAIFQHDEGVDDRVSETEELPPKESKAAAKTKAKPKGKTKKAASHKEVDKGQNEAAGQLALALVVEELSAEKSAVPSSSTSLGPRAASDAGEDSTGTGLETGAQEVDQGIKKTVTQKPPSHPGREVTRLPLSFCRCPKWRSWGSECWQGPATSSTSVPPSCRVTEEEREVPDLVGKGPRPLPHLHTSPLKRPADSSPDARVSKAPKLQQENDIAAFLARMRDQGVGFGDIISLMAAQSSKRLSFTLHLPLLTIRQIHPPRIQPQPCLLLFQGGVGLHWRLLLP